MGRHENGAHMAKESILVVDDEDDILELVSYNLAKEGYRVTGVGTGEEALRALREQSGCAVALFERDAMLAGSNVPAERIRRFGNC